MRLEIYEKLQCYLISQSNLLEKYYDNDLNSKIKNEFQRIHLNSICWSIYNKKYDSAMADCDRLISSVNNELSPVFELLGDIYFEKKEYA